MTPRPRPAIDNLALRRRDRARARRRRAPVVITANEAAWIEVRDGATVLKQGELAAGQSFEVPATATAPTLTTAKPEALRISVGTGDAPAIGPAGERVANVSLLGPDLLRGPAAAAAAPATATPAPAPSPTARRAAPVSRRPAPAGHRAAPRGHAAARGTSARASRRRRPPTRNDIQRRDSPARAAWRRHRNNQDP